MLSRTAENLFWLGRYVERAENVARLVEAARRLDLMPLDTPEHGTEWQAILIAAGCRETFPGGIEQAAGRSALHHLILDDKNPSSITHCFSMARINARAQRVAITQEVWGAVNDGFRQVGALTTRDLGGGSLAGTLELIRSLAAVFRGSVDGTMLRDEGYEFIRLGQSIERADATARLLDVKYHVLLPVDHLVGSPYDQLQWNHLLRAAGARSAYRWSYRAPVSANLVVDFLLLNRRCPRSLRHSFDVICKSLENLFEAPGRSSNALQEARHIRAMLQNGDAKQILKSGLHEYLTERIITTNRLAGLIGQDFGFGSQVTITQNQSIS